MNALLIFIGGGLGSLARYGTGKIFESCSASGFPVGTLAANIISSLILGLFLGLMPQLAGRFDSFRMFIAVGFCGGFSTFSTFSAETLEMIRNGMFAYAALNILMSVTVCIISIMIGLWAARSIGM